MLSEVRPQVGEKLNMGQPLGLQLGLAPRLRLAKQCTYPAPMSCAALLLNGQKWSNSKALLQRSKPHQLNSILSEGLPVTHGNVDGRLLPFPPQRLRQRVSLLLGDAP